MHVMPFVFYDLKMRVSNPHSPLVLKLPILGCALDGPFKLVAKRLRKELFDRDLKLLAKHDREPRVDVVLVMLAQRSRRPEYMPEATHNLGRAQSNLLVAHLVFLLCRHVVNALLDLGNLFI